MKDDAQDIFLYHTLHITDAQQHAVFDDDL